MKYTKEKGVIAIDTNASPIHLAIAEVSKTGELLSYQNISLHNLLGLSQNSKDHQEWILAHQLLDIAIQKGKAIAIENLKKLKRGMRGDGKAKLRRRLHHWNAKKFLQKLKRVAMIKGVEVIEVNPAYTSVIGMLKYAPQLSIDKDIAGAYVIGRRALGFKEDMPENYEKLLKDRAYLEFALKRYEEREKELTELLEKETNEYKRKKTSTFGIHRLGWFMVRTWSSSDTLRNMKARQVIEEILSKVFKWHRFPVSLKAEAVLLYFKGLSLRAVREFLLHKGYKVSIETIREWFHAVGKALQAICTTAIWVYVDETKIKARDRTYYLWLAVDEKGLPVFVHLSRRRDAWTAKLVLCNTEAKGCTTDKGPWYVSAVKGLAMEWEHETFGKRNVVERWFFYIKHRIKRFYKRFPWNVKYETVYRWLAFFIVIYTVMNLKS